MSGAIGGHGGFPASSRRKLSVLRLVCEGEGDGAWSPDGLLQPGDFFVQAVLLSLLRVGSAGGSAVVRGHSRRSSGRGLGSYSPAPRGAPSCSHGSVPTAQAAGAGAAETCTVGAQLAFRVCRERTRLSRRQFSFLRLGGSPVGARALRDK